MPDENRPAPPTGDMPMFETPLPRPPNRFSVRKVEAKNTIMLPMPLPAAMTRANALELAAHLVVLADEEVAPDETGCAAYKWISPLVEQIRKG